MRVGGLSEIPEKRMEQKKGERDKDFKKGSKLGQGVGALKRGARTPLQTMGHKNSKYI